MNPKVLFSVLRELGLLFEAPGVGESHDPPSAEAQASGESQALQVIE